MTQLVTGLVILLVGGVLPWATGQPVVALIGVVLVLGGYAWSPRSYRVADGELRIRRLVGTVAVPLSTIIEARRAECDDMTGCLRLFGSGAFFGYYGLFRTSKLGKCHWYLTRRDRVVIIRTAERILLLSPDDVDGFLTAIPAGATGGGLPPTERATSSGRGALWIGATLGIALGVAVAVLVMFAVTYAPGPPRYTLTAQSLQIEDRFYPVTVSASSVDVDGIAVVSPVAGSPWLIAARTNGFSNSHYHSGWYRTANGKKVRLYRAEGTRLVLLPPKGEGFPVLIEAADPNGFADRLRREWCGR
jgi:hypothetical protein